MEVSIFICQVDGMTSNLAASTHLFTAIQQVRCKTFRLQNGTRYPKHLERNIVAVSVYSAAIKSFAELIGFKDWDCYGASAVLAF